VRFATTSNFVVGVIPACGLPRALAKLGSHSLRGITRQRRLAGDGNEPNSLRDSLISVCPTTERSGWPNDESLDGDPECRLMRLNPDKPVSFQDLSK